MGRGQRSVGAFSEQHAHTLTVEAGSLSISVHSNGEEGRGPAADMGPIALYKQMQKGARTYPEVSCVREKG